jgi:hypothetical protein
VQPEEGSSHARAGRNETEEEAYESSRHLDSEVPGYVFKSSSLDWNGCDVGCLSPSEMNWRHNFPDRSEFQHHYQNKKKKIVSFPELQLI